MTVLLAILGLGVLMAVHEGGHFLVARLFKMRVLKYSIGFGPVLWSKKPKGSETTYQIALLPFLAYVQIAGMNPQEDVDPDDKASYANASWHARFLTIVAGPLANYFLAVLAFFFLLLAAGRPAGLDGLKVGAVTDDGPAHSANVLVGDEVRTIDGKEIKDWTDLREQIQAHKGKPMTMVVERNGADVELHMTPSPQDGTVGIRPKELRENVGVIDAAKSSLVDPPKIAFAMVQGLYRLVTLKEKPQLRSVPRIVQDAAGEIKRGYEDGVSFFALLSIYICIFNLIPFPALDGGRLAFLVYEFVARKRTPAKFEGYVHMAGMLVLLSLFVPIFFFEIWQLVGKLFSHS